MAEPSPVAESLKVARESDRPFKERPDIKPETYFLYMNFQGWKPRGVAFQPPHLVVSMMSWLE